MVIWITGLSGSGKTTLCRKLWERLKPEHPELVLLDGDRVRAAFGNDLGYHEADRKIQIRRMQELAKMLSEQGLVVLVAALYASPELLEWNRAHLAGYFEVYLEASLTTLQARDPKRIYRQAKQGSLRDVVGLDIPWHVPFNPDLVVSMDAGPTLEEAADEILSVAFALERGLSARVSA